MASSWPPLLTASPQQLTSPSSLLCQPQVQKYLLIYSQSVTIFSCSFFARQSVKSIISTVFMMSPTVYRQLYFLESSLALLLIAYGWTPQSSPTVWLIPYLPIRVVFHGEISNTTYEADYMREPLYYTSVDVMIGMARMPASRNTFSKPPNSQTKEL